MASKTGTRLVHYFEKTVGNHSKSFIERGNRSNYEVKIFCHHILDFGVDRVLYVVERFRNTELNSELNHGIVVW